MCNGIKIVWLGFENLPKMTKKQPVLNFFNFLEGGRNESNELFYSHFTPCQIHKWATATKSFGCDFGNISRSCREMTKKQ